MAWLAFSPRGEPAAGVAQAAPIVLATKSRNVTPPAAIFWESPFDPNPDLPPRIDRYILEVAIIIPRHPARQQNRIPGPPYRHFQVWVPRVPLAGDSQREISARLGAPSSV